MGFQPGLLHLRQLFCSRHYLDVGGFDIALASGHAPDRFAFRRICCRGQPLARFLAAVAGSTVAGRLVAQCDSQGFAVECRCTNTGGHHLMVHQQGNRYGRNAPACGRFRMSIR